MKFILLLSAIIATGGCQKTVKDSCPLEHFEFVVLDTQGNTLFKAADPNLVDIYYFKNGAAQSIKSECPSTSCIRPFPNGSPYPFYYFSGTAPIVSARDKITDFYINIGGDVDTIKLLASIRPGGDDICAKVDDARYNGRAAIKTTTSPTTMLSPTYIFQKK